MKITIETVPAVPTDSPEYRAFMDQLFGPFVQLVPLKDVDYVQTQTTPIMVYDYEFKAQDNRKWKQTIDWPGGFSADPSVSFPEDGAGDRWTIEEFQKHITFRNTIFTLTRKFGITECHCKWVP